MNKINLNYKLEQEDNEQRIKENMGNPVNYKDSIILQHYLSDLFVSVSNKYKKNNALNKKAQLTQELTNSVILNFKPRFKYRSLESMVHYNDDLVITSMKKEFSLQFFHSKLVKRFDERFEFKMRKNLRFVHKEQEKYKCYFQNEEQQVWKIVLFKSPSPEDEFI